MEETKIIELLENTPSLLNDLLSKIPGDKLKICRIPGKWSIHEHACHIVVVQPMLNSRLKSFINDENPEFKTYIPGTTVPDDLIEMDMKITLGKFEGLRKEFIYLLKTLDDSLWQKKALHPQYTEYTPYIMARHVLLHDYTHMYRIEELWLTKELP